VIRTSGHLQKKFSTSLYSLERRFVDGCTHKACPSLPTQGPAEEKSNQQLAAELHAEKERNFMLSQFDFMLANYDI
jgi:hypothetical protein